MEDTTLNPISGEQVPIQEISANYLDVPDSQASVPVTQQVPQPANAKEFVIEKKMNTLKRSIFILGGILVMLLVALVSVLAILANKPVPVPVVTPTAQPTQAAPVGNENVPKDVVDRVNTMEQKINSLDIQENELSYPKMDWEIKY